MHTLRQSAEKLVLEGVTSFQEMLKTTFENYGGKENADSRHFKSSAATEPVSYTHLDVYKRQAVTHVFVDDPTGGYGICIDEML